MIRVQCFQQIELAPLHRSRCMRTANILDQLFDLPILRIDECALENTRKKSGLPVFGILDGQPARAHSDESREVLILRPQAVEHPGAEARPGLHRVAAVH